VLVTELTVPHADAALIQHSSRSASQKEFAHPMAFSYCLAREQKAAEVEASDKFTITLDILQE